MGNKEKNFLFNRMRRYCINLATLEAEVKMAVTFKLCHEDVVKYLEKQYNFKKYGLFLNLKPEEIFEQLFDIFEEEN